MHPAVTPAAKLEAPAPATSRCTIPPAGLTPEIFVKRGFGSCGWLNNDTYENVFALAHGMMGDKGNGNLYCGRMATITLYGKTATGKLVGKCDGQSIDLSDHLFADLDASIYTDRYHNVNCSFTT